MRSRLDPPALIAAAVAALHAGSFGLAEPIRTDARYYTYYAWRVAQGDVPHRDFLVVKTQLATVVGAGLHAVAKVLGLDPLAVTRAGFLGISALAAFLVFAVARRLGGGRAAAGFLGLAVPCAFPLLAYLPSLGVLPKLLMTVAAWAAALAVLRERWTLAGALAAVALLDWQLGGLVLVGVLLAAGLQARPRGPALSRVLLGAGLTVLPFFLWLTLEGALVPAFQQTVLELFARSEEAARPLDRRFAQIGRCLEMGAPGATPWLWLAAAGLPLGVLGMVRFRELRGALAVLLVHQIGVTLFSLRDFQWYGDLFVLLHAAVLGLVLVGVAAVRASERLPARARHVVAGGLVLAALALARPGPLRRPYELPERGPGSRGATLADQREVAGRVRELVGDRRLAALGMAELMYLLRERNPLPVVWFNDWVWQQLRREGETKAETAERLVLECGARAVLPSLVQPLDLSAHGFEPHRLEAESGRYRADVLLAPR